MEIVSSPLPALLIDVGDTSLHRDPQARIAQGTLAPTQQAMQPAPPAPAPAGDTVAGTLLARIAAVAAQQEGLPQLVTDLVRAQPVAVVPPSVRNEMARVITLAEPILAQNRPAAATPAGSTPAQPAIHPEALQVLALAIERLQSSLRSWQPGAIPPPAQPAPAMPQLQPQARSGGIADALVSMVAAQHLLAAPPETQRRPRPNTQPVAQATEPDALPPGTASALSAYRKAIPSAQQRQAPPWPADPSPVLVARTLLEAADKALTQTRLLEVTAQVLSAEQAPQTAGAAGPAHWAFDLPLATGLGQALVRFEIDRNANGARDDAPEPTWRARLSLDIEPLGPITAQVALRGSRAFVSLWAERDETALLLNAHKPALRQAMGADQLEADVVLQTGLPAGDPGPRGTKWTTNA